MNDYEQQLHKKWDEINYYSGGSIQLTLEHPLEWHVSYFTETQKAIVIVSDTAVNHIESSKSIEATCKTRQDGRYAISFSLLIRDQEDVFITMCGDMIRYSSTETNPQVALKKVLQRYKQWSQLLEHQKSVLMGSSAQKGLIGELLYLKESLEEGIKSSDALAGWVGPDGADQDFVYSDGWHEIKTTGISSTEVTISSIEQLDSDDTGELVVMRVDKCAPAKPGAFSLFSLVHRLFFMLNGEPASLESFVSKLNCVGYIDLPIYDEQKYVFSSQQCYTVSEAFPRLRRSALPAAIVNGSYTLSLPSIQAWVK